MNDLEPSEDSTIIKQFSVGLPGADTSSRQRVCTLLRTFSLQQQLLVPTCWRRIALSGLVTSCVVLVALVLLLQRPAASTASAYQILHREAVGGLTSGGYSGSAVITFTESPVDELPRNGIKDVGRHKMVTTWTVENTSHYRVDVHTLLPVIESGDEPIVVNGKRIVRYSDVTGKAVTGPTDPSFPPFLLGVLQGGRPLPLAQSIEEIVKTLNGVLVDTQFHPPTPYGASHGDSRLVLIFDPTTSALLAKEETLVHHMADTTAPRWNCGCLHARFVLPRYPVHCIAIIPRSELPALGLAPLPQKTVAVQRHIAGWSGTLRRKAEGGPHADDD